MQKVYNRIKWENYPSDATPLNETNLNKIDFATNEIDNRVITLDTTKFNKTEAQTLIKNVTFDLQTGILTKYYYNGSTEEINTGLSKLNLDLRFDKETQTLYIINADGTEDPVDLSVFITNYEFDDSETIAHNVSGGRVSSVVKEGSIEEKHLQPNYLADIKVETAKAEQSANNASQSESASKISAAEAESWAHGGTGTREDEDTDNSKYYSEQAKAGSQTAAAYLTQVEQAGSDAVNAIKNAFNINAPKFLVDLETGHLMYEGGRFDFQVNSEGHLEWGVAV